MLAPVRVEVKRGRVSDVTTGFVGNDGNVVAYLILVRPSFLRVKRIANRHVRRPCNAGVRAVGVEKLRIEIVRVPVVVPNRVKPAVGRDRKRAEPMPLTRVVIIVDPHRRAESYATVGASDEHHVGRASPGRLHAR